MIRYMIPLIAASALATPAAAAEIQIPAQGPVVELSVSEIVNSVPDTAQVGAGVMTRASTAQEAARLNAVAMNKVVAKIRALGIPEKDIQTTNFSLSPNYNYNQQTGQQVFAGYDASNQVSVKLRDMKRVGEVLDALIAAGANNLFGPNFTLDNDAAAKAAARNAAFKRGYDMAMDYARMAGFSGVRLLEISESLQNVGPMPMMRAVQTLDVAEKTPVVPGEVGTGVNLTVKYEMTR